jgi:HrpA-like RNA helicase
LCLFPDSSKTNKKTPVKENKKLVNAVSSIPDSSTAHIKTKVAKSDEVPPPPSVVEDNGGGIVGTPRTGSCQEVDPTELVPPIDPTIDLSSPVCHDESVSASLLAEREAMCSQSRYESVLQGRKNLPMFKARESFLNELKSSENKTLIVVGDTG